LLVPGLDNESILDRNQVKIEIDFRVITINVLSNSFLQNQINSLLYPEGVEELPWEKLSDNIRLNSAHFKYELPDDSINFDPPKRRGDLDFEIHSGVLIINLKRWSGLDDEEIDEGNKEDV